MRALLQRVKNASVAIDGTIVGQIEQGLLLLLGIEASDNDDDIDYLIRKITQLRIFNDQQGVMNLSVTDIGGEILVVSQFTLMASTRKGNRPSYIHAARPEIAEPIYQRFVQHLQQTYPRPIATGRFGADMQVSLLNDGPVTILIDSKNKT